MNTKVYVENKSIPFFEVEIKNPLQAADTIKIKSPEEIDFDINPQTRVVGDHYSFGGFITKAKETEEGYEYEGIDYTRLLHGKQYRSFQNMTTHEIIIDLLQARGVGTGGIQTTSTRRAELIFHNRKAVEICHQVANLEDNMEFFVNQDNEGILRSVPEITEGYIFFSPSYTDYELSYDSSEVITGVGVYGVDDRWLVTLKDEVMAAKYGKIEEIVNDASLTNETDATAKGQEVLNEHNKIEFSGSITTKILPQMKSGEWIVFIPPKWSKSGIKAYYTQEVVTKISANTEEQTIDILNAKPAPPSEWIYEKVPPNASISFTLQDLLDKLPSVNEIEAKARALGSAREIRRWIDANIQYEFYYYPDKVYTPIQVLQYRKGNCHDQSALYVAMCQAINVEAYVRCGQVCNGYAHCDAMAFVDGRWIQVDVTCASRNQLE